MPMYEFRCKECETFELILTDLKDDTPAPLCKECGKPMVRQIGTPSFVFTGKGFYSTDYKDKK